MSFDVLLIDGKHALYRAIDANADLRCDGAPVGAIYGFMTILCSTQRQFGGQVTVCWDDWVSGPAVRKSWYADYKRKEPNPSVLEDERAEVAASMPAQQHILMGILEQFGIFQAYSPGWEADDVLGTLARRLSAQGQTVGILSGDRDLLQCVSPTVTLIRPRPKGEFLLETPATVEAEWGVPPERFVELKALMGDPGDNIPGCKGIGKVTAGKILARFPDTGVAIAVATSETGKWELSERWREMVKGAADDIRLSKKLATINCSVPLKFRTRKPDKKQALDSMIRYKFKSILRSGRFDQLVSLGA